MNLGITKPKAVISIDDMHEKRGMPRASYRELLMSMSPLSAHDVAGLFYLAGSLLFLVGSLLNIVR